jgi:flagellin
MRASLGAIENRLDHAVDNLMNVSENTEAARSRIQDADFAAESAKLSKAQVLKQAGVGMLAQANAGSQLVLQLLQ